MGDGYLLGIDIGTSGCKVAAFAPGGEVLFQTVASYPTLSAKDGFAEQDADDWWRAVCTCLRRMWSSGRLHPDGVLAVGVDGQSWTALPVDAKGRPLRNAIIWLDRRATEECAWLRDAIGEDEILSVSGNPLSPGYTTPKLLWLRAHEPDIYRQTHRFLQSNSFIVCRLTGRFTHDLSQGNGVHAFDVGAGCWSEQLCEAMGIERTLLPDLVPSCEMVGEVTSAAARETGLRPGTPVVAGGLDAACGTLGAGVVSPGQVQEQGGQAGGMSIVTGEPVRDRRLILGCHVVEGAWLLQGGTVGGGSLRWFRREFAREFVNVSDGEAYAAIDCEAETVWPGSGGLLFLPYMAGERSPIWDVHARGVFLGLTYETTRAHMARAIMEGCAFALEHNLQTARAGGVSAEELHSVGGAANSRVWTQIKADVTGKTIRIPATDTATTLGAALLAGTGAGVFPDLREAVRRMVRFGRTHEPDPRAHERYAGMFELYLRTYERLRDVFPLLGG